MKKMITIIVLICLVTVILTACGGEKCQICGEKSTTTYEYSNGYSGQVMIGDRVHIFYSNNEAPLCDEHYNLVKGELD